MEEISYFEQLNTLNNFLKEVYDKNKSHAYLFISEDSFTTQIATKLFAMFFVCNNKQKGIPCFLCSSCQKVLNKTAVDMFTYPRKASIIVEDVKEIIGNAQSKPLDFNNKIFILNNIHEANLSAQNKLLKTLEEPPHNVIFMLSAPSENTVLPTIASRVKTIVLPKAKKEELFNILKEVEVDEKRKAITLDVAQGSLGKALSIIKNEVYFSIYNFCLEVIDKMNHSKKVINYSSTIEKNKKYIDLYLEILTLFYRDMLLLKEGEKEGVINKYNLSLLELFSQNYSQLALIKIIEKLEQAKKMINFNTNVTAVIDSLLLGILEVKYKWKI